jgi:6,7-dimethyl-8-ribityllumazine synthase
MQDIKVIEGKLAAQGLNIAIVAARFNDFVVESLIDGAADYLTRHGLDPEKLTLVRVPGAFELPLACQKLAQSGKFDGLVALGAVIRGATPHFEYVCAEATKGIAQVSLQNGLPIGFGLLTTEDLNQAVERAGGKAGNKGADASAAMLETIQDLRQI